MHKMHHSPQPAPMSNTMLSEAADSPPQQYPDSPYHQDTPPYKEPPPIVMQDSPQYVPTSSEHISGIHQGKGTLLSLPFVNLGTLLSLPFVNLGTLLSLPFVNLGTLLSLPFVNLLIITFN